MKRVISTIQRAHYRAQTNLTKFRQVSFFSVILTTFLYFITGIPTSHSNPESSIEEAKSTINTLIENFIGILPKLTIALIILLVFWGCAKLFESFYKKLSIPMQRSTGVIALVKLVLGGISLIIALTILAGDVRALLGSVGLLGLALSWALQQPIESFSGYLLNAFRSYYRIGDRIQVGSVNGDVYKVDFLTTTVWEVGGSGKSISGSQPTGALITFPNSEVLRANIVNFSRDFPYVWDEVTIGVANESDLHYTVNIFRNLAKKLIGESMKESSIAYQNLLRARGLEYSIELYPEVYLTGADSWTNCTIRYLVELRKKRTWSSLLYEKICNEIAQEIHHQKIIPAYPRTLVETLRAS